MVTLETGAACRYRLWSLLDMLSIYAPGLTSVIADLKALALSITLARNDAERAASRKEIAAKIDQLKELLSDVPLSNVLRAKINRLIDAAKPDATYAANDLMVMTREFYLSLLEELATSHFLMIPEPRTSFYEQPEPPFGAAVDKAFPDAYRDIRAASRCLALDEWTACVFHLMRALEIGLRDMAVGLNIPMSASVDYLQWAEIIDQINSAVGKMGQQKKSPQRTERQKFYAQAATNFDHFKNAWRNHVSHSREHYDERDAVTTWNHVATFMQVLAGGAP